jgi:hypothetical protein
MNVVAMPKKLACDVCGKFYESLGSYDDIGDWWVCWRCFEKADVMAAREDRWPEAKDFTQLKGERGGNA